MIRPSLSPRGRACARHAAFTLIELLTVIAIILVLAGLLLHIAGGANTKASLARARTEIEAMSTALESYKADNGSYPRIAISDATIKSDVLNAQNDTDPGNANYQTSGKVLYQTLSGYTPAGTTPLNRAYMTFKPGQLSTNTGAPTAATVVVDPFGIVYGYSTANLNAQETINSGGTAPNPMPGYNPTFDLWSTGGFGTGGKTYGSSGVASTSYSTLWVKNW